MTDAGTDNEDTDWRRLLTPGERARMLDDIARVALSVGARLFPDQPWQNMGVAAYSLGTTQSPLERLGFIERLLPRLSQDVAQIARSPLTDAVTGTRPVAPPVRARRVGAGALLQAARRGPAIRSLDETVVFVTRDTPENRAVRSFLCVLETDCATVARLAAAEGEAEAALRALRCGDALRRLLRDPGWEEVRADPAAWTRPATLRASARPEYARLGREMRRYRAGSLFDWDQPLFSLPPRETWRLYETWTLFNVLEALGRLGYSPEGDANGLFTIRAGRLLPTLAPGEPSRLMLGSPQGRRLSLTYNQTFAQGAGSLTHAMQPDITLAQDGRLWALDAKFKPYALPGEEGDDINQMHAYRDAIIDSQGRRCVARAWCLYAGLAGTPNRPHLTYGRSQDAAVGALCLRPGAGETFSRLCALLETWLPPSEPPASPAS